MIGGLTETAGGRRPPSVVPVTGDRVHVFIARVDLHLPAAGNLKEKRAVVTSIVRNLDQMHAVAAAEVGLQDRWQRSLLAVSVVGGEVGHVQQVMDRVERHLWSRPDVEVIEFTTSWWEED